jgi:4'-phosphopantetheinyl transferase
LSDVLSPVEAARSARFATGDERRRYVVSHGALRLILSAFTGRDSRAIHIAIGARGKPYVVGPGPHFSLSHDGDLAVVAVTTQGPIGVDVERIRPDLGLDTFVRPLVPASDVVRIEALCPEQRSRAWFQAWTRLEAVAKASGKGLSDDWLADLGGPARFRIWNLDVDQARVGAVATPLSVAHVVYEAFPNESSALARFGSA